MNTKFALSGLTLALSLALTACGGGDDKDQSSSKPDPKPPASSAVTDLGADTFIMTAVEGDTFNIKFNRNTSTATIKPLNNLFNLQEEQEIPVKITKSNLGITIYTTVNEVRGQGNSWFEIMTSPDGNEIIGQVEIGNLQSNIIGTNLQLNRTSDLPINGSYNGVSVEATSAYGQKKLIDFGIKSTNGQLSYCDNGYYVNDSCTGEEFPASFDTTTWFGMASLNVHFNSGKQKFAYLLLARNGAEYSLILDRLQDRNGMNVYGTGYAAPAKPMTLGVTSKSYACVKQDASGGSLVTFNGATSYLENTYDGKFNPTGSTAGTLALNKAVNRNMIVNANGIVSFIENGGSMVPTQKYKRGMNFSKNMMILAQESTQELSVCRSDSLVVQ